MNLLIFSLDFRLTIAESVTMHDFMTLYKKRCGT